MKTYTFGDLKVLTNTDIDTNSQWNSIACNSRGVNLSFSDTKFLHIKGTGVWTHSVVIWAGEYTPLFREFKKALSTNSIIYKNKEVVALYLSNNKHYGSLQVSCKLHKSGEVILKNNLGNHTLKMLDELYEMYIDNRTINECMNQLMSFPHSIDLMGCSHDTIMMRRLIYDTFTEPFTLGPDTACKEYEDEMALALNVKRKLRIRQIFVELYAYAVSLAKLDSVTA